MGSTRGPGQRAGLSRDQVLEAAAELITDRGRVTMRAVAERLGVAPNALYSHVASRTELVDGVLDRALAQVEAPTTGPGVDPGDAMHRLMTSSHEALLRHPQLVPEFLARQGARGPHARRLGAVLLEHLAAAGVTGDAAREAVRVLIVYTIGFAAFHGSPGERPVPGPELRGNFDRGLRWLIAGILSDAAR